EDVDLAAAREPDRPGELVLDPVGEQDRPACTQDLLRVLVHVGLDATAGHRARELARLRDRELRPDRARRRAPGRDDGRDRHLLATRPEALDVREDLLHAACLLSMPARTPASCSSPARFCPGRNRSTYGRAARMPPASGWYSGLPL